MKTRGADRPESVVTVTGTLAGSPGIRAGTWTVQSCIRGQLTGAWVGPNVTMISPLGLKRPEPVRVTTVPAGPEAGDILSCEGGPAETAGAGAPPLPDATGPARGVGEGAEPLDEPGPGGAVDAGGAVVVATVVRRVVVGGTVVGGRVRTVGGGTDRAVVTAVEVWTLELPVEATAAMTAVIPASPAAVRPATRPQRRCGCGSACGSSRGRPGGSP
jgi:hypothetical protein